MSESIDQSDRTDVPRSNWLAWLTVALAMSPLIGALSVTAFEILVPPQGHNPFLSGGGPWKGLVMVLVITAPVHVPYLAVLCLTARGLFRHDRWASVGTLVLAPFATLLSLAAFGFAFADFMTWMNSAPGIHQHLEGVLLMLPTAVVAMLYSVSVGVMTITRWQRFRKFV